MLDGLDDSALAGIAPDSLDAVLKRSRLVDSSGVYD
jgi:hypothetical protein